MAFAEADKGCYDVGGLKGFEYGSYYTKDETKNQGLKNTPSVACVFDRLVTDYKTKNKGNGKDPEYYHLFDQNCAYFARKVATAVLETGGADQGEIRKQKDLWDARMQNSKGMQKALEDSAKAGLLETTLKVDVLMGGVLNGLHKNDQGQSQSSKWSGKAKEMCAANPANPRFKALLRTSN
eukprot:g3465.t1